MSEIEYRCEAQATLRPEATEGLVGGGHIQLVTLELHDSGELGDEQGRQIHRPKVRCDLRATEARLLGYMLLWLAERAELRRFEPDRAAARVRARAAARDAAHAAAEDSLG
jgi:hypothetical protein